MNNSIDVFTLSLDGFIILIVTTKWEIYFHIFVLNSLRC